MPGEGSSAGGAPLGRWNRLSASPGDRPTSGADLIPPTMSIREVRKRYPATLPVLERYGLGDCGGEDGPDEPVAWFATVHRLPLDEFLRDLRAAAERAPAPPPSPHPAPAGAPGTAFSPHFILGSLFLTLTLGATTGMINLLRIAAGAEVPIDHRQIHAPHADPRVRGTLSDGDRVPRASAHPRDRRDAARPLGPRELLADVRGSRGAKRRPAVRVLPGGAAGRVPLGRDGARLGAPLRELRIRPVAARARGQVRPQGPAPPIRARRDDLLPGGDRAGRRTERVAGGTRRPRRCRRRSRSRSTSPRSMDSSSRGSTASGTASSRSFSASVAGQKHLHRGRARRAGGRRRPRLRVLAAGPGSPLRARAERRRPPARRPLRRRLPRRQRVPLAPRHVFPAMRTPGSPTFAIRAAFGSLGLWSVLEIAAVVVSRTTRIPAQNLWWADAARHVFNIGFLTLLIVGMSFRILPVFSGQDRSGRRASPTRPTRLLLAGTAMRLLPVPGRVRAGVLPRRLLDGRARRPRARALRRQPGPHDARRRRLAATPLRARRAAGFSSTLPVR